MLNKIYVLQYIKVRVNNGLKIQRFYFAFPIGLVFHLTAPAYFFNVTYILPILQQEVYVHICGIKYLYANSIQFYIHYCK